MPNAFQRLRRRVQLVNYYSANRNRNGWARARAWSLPLALLLAPIGMLFGEAITTTAVDGRSEGGILVAHPDGNTSAIVVDPDGRWGTKNNDRVLGEWTLTMVRHRSGWPWSSRQRIGPPRLDVNFYDEADIRIDARLAEDAPERTAIDTALRQPGGDNGLAADWERGEPPVVRHVGGTLGSLGTWWLSLTFLFVGVLFAGEFLANLRHHRKHGDERDRWNRGRCGTCNYDLRGLEFHERCPECGVLQR